MTLRHAAVAGLVSAPAGFGCNAVLGLEELTYREGSAGEAGRDNVGGAGQAGPPSTGGTARPMPDRLSTGRSEGERDAWAGA